MGVIISTYVIYFFLLFWIEYIKRYSDPKYIRVHPYNIPLQESLSIIWKSN